MGSSGEKEQLNNSKSSAYQGRPKINQQLIIGKEIVGNLALPSLLHSRGDVKGSIDLGDQVLEASQSLHTR